MTGPLTHADTDALPGALSAQRPTPDGTRWRSQLIDAGVIVPASYRRLAPELERQQSLDAWLEAEGLPFLPIGGIGARVAAFELARPRRQGGW